MSYTVVKTIKGINYLYQYRSEWIDGHSKSIFEAYLGRADKLGSRDIAITSDKLGSRIATVKPISKPKLGSRIKAWFKWRRKVKP